MKEVVILGTTHEIQEGNRLSVEFKAYINKLVKIYNISSIAEEIEDSNVHIAATVCAELGLSHEIIDPNPKYYKRLGIKPIADIEYEVMQLHFLNVSPLNRDKVSPEVLLDFDSRMREEHSSKREKEWLKNILALNTWPLLVIVGANHFTYFSDLLLENKIKVHKAAPNWPREK
ncbi:hypothetical protein [Psychrosphaera aestuarii]|uniref:hypothetical protein n=1 Tax=Psychrosphaera aestuarii TaxID=1266052 RepID=UPI001B343D00|nr:hypothetical protein [Psychrosphaera aestuarii]